MNLLSREEDFQRFREMLGSENLVACQLEDNHATASSQLAPKKARAVGKRMPDPASSNANEHLAKSASTSLQPINTISKGQNGLGTSNRSTKRRKTGQHAAGELCHSNSGRAEPTSVMHIDFVTASQEEGATRSTGRGNREQQHHDSQSPRVDHAGVFLRTALSPHDHAVSVEPESGAGSGQAHPYPSPIKTSSRPTFQCTNEPITSTLCHRPQEASLHLLAHAAAQAEPGSAVPCPWGLPREESDVRSLSPRDIENAALPPQPHLTLSDGSLVPIGCLSGQGAGLEGGIGTGVQEAPRGTMLPKSPGRSEAAGQAGRLDQEEPGESPQGEAWDVNMSDLMDEFLNV